MKKIPKNIAGKAKKNYIKQSNRSEYNHPLDLINPRAAEASIHQSVDPSESKSSQLNLLELPNPSAGESQLISPNHPVPKSQVNMQSSDSISPNIGNPSFQSFILLKENQAKIYNSLSRAVLTLQSDIISECSRRVSAIKKSTSEAISQIFKLKKHIKELYKNNNIHPLTLTLLKTYSESAATYYKPQCEEFSIYIEKLKKDISNNSQELVIEPAGNTESNWGIEKNGEIVPLPNWVVSQIQIGEKYQSTTVGIYKKSVLVSIADLKEKKYVGVSSNGKHLPAQRLVKIN